MKKFIPLLSVISFLSLHDIALACPEHKGRGGPIKELDQNNDEQLSLEEVKGKPFFADKFNEIDTDKNGQLSREELKAHRKANKAERTKGSSEAPAQ